MFFFMNLIIDNMLRFCKVPSKIRWFAIHAIQNICTMVFIFDELMTAFQYPMDIYFIETNFHAYAIVLSLHLYHAIFFSLNAADIFHHVVFTFLGVMYALYTQPYIVSSIPLLSLHGLPGAIDYLLLIMVHYDKVSQKKHKYINLLLNTWFRAPYSLFVSGFAIPSMVKYSRYECLPCVILVMFNGIYYNLAVAESYFTKFA